MPVEKNSKYTIYQIRNMIYGLDVNVKLENGKQVPVINLDNAATTPPFKDVMAGIKAGLRCYGSIGRGTGQKSVYSTKVYEDGRDIIKSFFGITPQNKAAYEKYTVIYTGNTTDGMNKLASALIDNARGNNFSVICTRMEHHANDLPWRERLCPSRIFFAETDENGRLKAHDIERLLKTCANVKYVCVTAASNVTGYVNDLHEIARCAHKYGAKIIVDGAQITAHREFNMLGKYDDDIDFLLFSAHKMYSPFGGGAIVGLNEILEKYIPRFYGGGMVDAVYDYGVEYLPPPALYEAGSPNYPGVLGMLRAMEILKDIGFDNIDRHERLLMKRAIAALTQIPGIKLYGDNESFDDRVGIIAFNIGDIPDSRTSRILAQEYAIAVRDRKFCAHPYVKRLIAAFDRKHRVQSAQDGMVRASFGIYTSPSEVDALIHAVERIVRRA